MKNILLCSSNTILVKSLYGLLRDEGHCVVSIEHTAFAVQLVMQRHVDLIVIDTEPFGLSAEDAANIIREVSPQTRILSIATQLADEDPRTTSVLNLEHLSQLIHSMAA